MIEWTHNSTEDGRIRDTNMLVKLATARRTHLVEHDALTKKLARQRSPASIIKMSDAVASHAALLIEAQKAYTELMTAMCLTHWVASVGDLVELEDSAGARCRNPIIIEEVEFNRSQSGEFWLQIKGFLWETSSTGRPQLSQSFDLWEFDTNRKILKHN